MATPVVVIGAVSGVSTIAYGASNLIESSQDIYYGAIGDPYTVAINPIRDTVFCGNQTAYDIWGGVSTTVAGLVIPVGQGITAAKAAGQTGKVMLGTVGKEVAKDFAQDAFVNAVSSGAGSAAMKVTGNANFSRAVSLASGVAGGSKSGKVLNSLDDIGTSTVKSLNHLDDVADVSKNLDDVAINKGGRYFVKSGINQLEPYSGVKRASDFLKEQGFSRGQRVEYLQSFDVRTIYMDVANESTYGFRFHDFGENAYPKGRYLYETFSNLSTREGAAIKQSWNNMTGIKQWKIQSGTTIIKGKAVSQIENGYKYQGGVEQWFISNTKYLQEP